MGGILSEIVRRQIWPDCRLQRCDHLLQPYFGAGRPRAQARRANYGGNTDSLWRPLTPGSLWRPHGCNCVDLEEQLRGLGRATQTQVLLTQFPLVRGAPPLILPLGRNYRSPSIGYIYIYMVQNVCSRGPVPGPGQVIYFWGLLGIHWRRPGFARVSRALPHCSSGCCA